MNYIRQTAIAINQELETISKFFNVPAEHIEVGDEPMDGRGDPLQAGLSKILLNLARIREALKDYRIEYDPVLPPMTEEERKGFLDRMTPLQRHAVLWAEEQMLKHSEPISNLRKFTDADDTDSSEKVTFRREKPTVRRKV